MLRPRFGVTIHQFAESPHFSGSAAMSSGNSYSTGSMAPSRLPSRIALALSSSALKITAAPVQDPNYGGPKVGIAGAVRSNFALKARLSGTEFLDAETGRQKSLPKRVSALPKPTTIAELCARAK